MARADAERDITSAQLAAQSGIRELLDAQESKILTRAVVAYRSGKLSPEKALVMIGVISEMRSLDAETDRTIERGRKAATSL